ncbi:RrF2 family transcriptional regulator [Frigidibacter sp. ROC022]|uniref:RrF2 family transcriptional regulator n=1 Tax=Frigidibacter sp. ROC022 TaxID=2971796 RepID=UPI00215B11E7|nr:Rrf2 family transcriptional regulator [Frigidibacter sp. ROC022]MCR8722686.1 Rrf2 family transcriptional regulator [Frigidibacter sp. ROC022]
MRLTTRTNLASRILMACAVNDRAIVRTADIAEKCNASINHLQQVVNMLQSNGFVETLRGRSGGLRLARPMEEISIGQVFRVFETSAAFAECFDPETNTCPLSDICRLRNYITRAVEAFYHELDMVTLADLVKGNCGLSALLDMAPQTRPDCRNAREDADADL